MSAPPPPPAVLPPDVSRGDKINAVTWSCTSIATVFVLARLYTRFRVTKNPGWDDAIITFALVLLIVTSALESGAVAAGLGRHTAYLDPTQLSRILYLSAILQPIGIFSYCFPKLAMIMLIRKLVGPQTSRNGLYFLWFLVVILFASSAAAAIIIFAQCNPASHFWKPTEPAKCISPFVLLHVSEFSSTWSAFTDICLAAFPVTFVWKLKMNMRNKIGVMVLMGLGFVAGISAIIKVTQLPLEEKPDFTWTFYGLVIWTSIETAIVIVCTCVPTLPRLFLLIIGKDPTQKAGYYPSTRSNRLERSRDTDDSYYDRIVESGSPDHKSGARPVHVRAASSNNSGSLPLEPVGNTTHIVHTVNIEQHWDAV